MSTHAPSLDRHAGRKNPRAARRTVARWARRIVLVAGGLAALAVLVYYWLPKPAVVETATVSKGPLEVTVEEEGKTRVRDRFVVAAPISGNLLRIDHEVGDAIGKDEVIARIEPPDPALLDPRSREEAEAHLAAAVAQQRAADTAIVRATASLGVATREAERTRKLSDSGAVTITERERDELNEKVAQADLAAAKEQKRAAVAQVAAAEATLGQGGGTAGRAFPVASPAAGRILKLDRDSAGPVQQGAPLVELGDPHALEAVIDVLSSDAARIAPGMPVEITAWGGDHPLAGTVTRVEPSAFTRISALGVEEQRVNIIVALSDAPPTLGDGFRVEGKIILWRGDALTVPANAVFRDRGRWAVYTVANGRAHLQPIEVGKRGRLAVEVTGGLSAGDVVILHPGDQVTDGGRVSADAPAR
jgi:HlyD family secretion protein